MSKIYSDNGTTFQAASKSLPSLLKSTGLKTSLREQEISWEFIAPYAPAQGGAWESMVKQIKRVIFQILDSSKRKPSLIKLITYMGSAVRIVNERPLIPLSDDAKDCTVITPAKIDEDQKRFLFEFKQENVNLFSAKLRPLKQKSSNFLSKSKTVVN